MLTDNQINDNWDEFINIIKTNISTGRREKLLAMYDEFKPELIIAPASSNKDYHNCFPGGYIDHVNRVVKCSRVQYQVWKETGAGVDGFTLEELIFSAINHDLGKAGDVTNPYYIPNPSDWHRKNQGSLYEMNSKLHYMKVPDRSLYTLQHYGIHVSENEYLAIKLHDGMYSDVNKSYYMAYKPELSLKTNLCIILHHADHLASRIEHTNGTNSRVVDAINSVSSAGKSKSFGKKLSTELSEADISDMFKLT